MSCFWPSSSPFHRVTLVLFWSGWGGLITWLLQRRPRLATWLPPGLTRRADLVLFTLCATGCGVELGLRMVDRVAPMPLLNRNESTLRLIERNRLQPGQLHFGEPADRWGFVDTQPQSSPKRRLIACIGDSMNVGVVPRRFHYTTICEDVAPSFSVYNMGVPNAGPWEYAEILRAQAMLMDLDALVIALFIGNDIVDAARRLGGREPLPMMFDRDNVLTFLLPLRLSRYFQQGGFSVPARKDARSGFVRGEAATVNGRREAPPWLDDPLLEPPTFSEDDFLRIERRRAEWVCQSGDSKFYQALWDCLQEIVHYAGKEPIFFLLIPDESQVEDSLWTKILESRDDSDPELDRDLPQRLVGEWLRSRGKPYLDLLPLFRTVEPLADGQ